MPLLKKRPFPLAAPPEDLRPGETVWQIRFTKEIFRSYPPLMYHILVGTRTYHQRIIDTFQREYLERMNLFRQRVWTCRITGKMHLTYEEALVSEKQANEKVLQFPQCFVAHVLHMVQYSVLKLNDLLTMIFENLKEAFLEGEELFGGSEKSSRLCKIFKILSSDRGPTYEVGWLNENGEVTSTSIVDKSKLFRKKFPFSRDLLKLFIKESASQSSPWVIHDKLAKKYGVATQPPEGLRDKIIKTQEAENIKASKKRRQNMIDESTATKLMKGKTDDGFVMEDIKYPIEDLLVKPSAEDPALNSRPVPSTKFLVPSSDVGDLLMIWDFLSCFDKVLYLSPFSLNEFENAIAHEGVSDFIIEAHASILTLLISDQGEYYSLIHQKKRKETIALKSWIQYLCDFLELENETKYLDYIRKIKDGNYSMLDVHAKLQIFGELLHWAISTEAIREQLESFIEKKQALIASKREEELEEMRKRREEKRLKETKAGDQECMPEHENLKGLNQSCSDAMEQNDMNRNDDIEAPPPTELRHAGNRGNKLDVLASRRELMKRNFEAKVAMEKEKEISRLEEVKRQQEENKARMKEAREKKMKEQKLEGFERDMEKLHIRTNSLGKDRDHNTYWFFQREGRIFVESADHNSWGYYSSKEELDALIGSLNPKGVRELSLQRHLQNHYFKICSAFQKRSKELAHKICLEDPAILRRSVRVSALPKDKHKRPSFLGYVNKWRK